MNEGLKWSRTEVLLDTIPLVSGTTQMCPKCNEDSRYGCTMANSIGEGKKDVISLSLSGIPRSSLTSVDNAFCEASGPPFVYQRQKLRRISEVDYDSGTTNRDNNLRDSFLPSSCSEVSMTDKSSHDRLMTDCEFVGNEVSVAPSLVRDIKKHHYVSQSKLPSQPSIFHQHDAEESSDVYMHKIIVVDSVNDSCSSKSTTELMSAPVKGETDGSVECSSSNVDVIEVIDGGPMRERDFCISVLSCEGLLDINKYIQTCISTAKVDLVNGGTMRRSCKACDGQGNVTKMLICDYCEEVFHLSCCNPRMKKAPEGDWYCSSCLEKKNLVKKQSGGKQPTRITTEMGRVRNDAASGDLHPVKLMLEDDEPYMSDVRVGKGFQADVPEWAGPMKVDADMIEQSLEMNSAEVFSSDDSTSKKYLMLGSIGNWLQCRQVRDYADGETICGKWRRAPLFEVQTEKWDCFCSVFWDPRHADCAIPQELETEQVLKQLKYIEMLIPQLTAKRQKTLSKNDNHKRSPGNRDIA